MMRQAGASVGRSGVVVIGSGVVVVTVPATASTTMLICTPNIAVQHASLGLVGGHTLR